MKKITLNQVINEQQKNANFNEHFQRELLINEISKMVLKMRNAAHLSQEELANLAGTTQPVIARLESGKDSRIPSLLLLSRIASASHVKLHIGFDKIKE